MDKKIIVSNLLPARCLCGKIATKRILGENKPTAFLCGVCFEKFSQNREVVLIGSEEENPLEKIRTTSLVESHIIGTPPFNKFGRREKNKKSREKEEEKLVKEFIAIIAWEHGNKSLLSNKYGYLVEFQGNYFVFSLLGTPLYKCTPDLKPLEYF